MTRKFPLRNLLAFPLRILVLLLSWDVVATSAYHVRRISSSNLNPSPQLYAIIVISGIAALYTLLTLLSFLLTVGALFFFLILMDLLFMGGFIALAILLRDAASVTCSDLPHGPLSPTSAISALAPTAADLWVSTSLDPAYVAEPSIACKVDKAAFACSVANAFFFLCLAGLSGMSFRRYRRNRAFGPGPSNDYRLQNNSRPGKTKRAGLPDAENGLVGAQRASDDETAVGSGIGSGVGNGSDHGQSSYTAKDGAFTRSGSFSGAGIFSPEVGAGRSVGKKEAFGKGYSGF